MVEPIVVARCMNICTATHATKFLLQFKNENPTGEILLGFLAFEIFVLGDPSKLLFLYLLQGDSP
jgi:hypothetical protein